jgi:hypothetical protein
MEDAYGQIINNDGWISTPRQSTFCLGLDLGQAQDPTAIAVVERVQEPIPPPDGIGTDLIQRLEPPRYECRYLETVPLQTPYPAIVLHVSKLLAKPPLNGKCKLVLDATGCGRPVADLFSSLDPSNVLITGGMDVEKRDFETSHGFWRVSKLILVSRLQAMLNSRELRIAADLPAAKLLVNELQNFRAQISEAGIALSVPASDDMMTWYWRSRSPAGTWPGARGA